jgi:actin-like ATPase involved in cell morphogenesis
VTEWTLAIDFGTTYTCAVMSFGDETEVVLVNGETRMPSAVLSDPDGHLVVGKLAELQGPSMPDRLERNPKRRLGDGIFLLGGEPVQVIKAVSEILKTVADEATRTRGGEVPSQLRLTHPARWAIDGVYVRTLSEAVALARLPDPSFVSEPVAAARFFGRGDLPTGSILAVYDLGGGTFDTTVLVREETGFELLGRPGGIPDLGGEDFDDSVFQMLGRQLGVEIWQSISTSTDRDARRTRLELRRQAREAKEALSVRSEWSFLAPPPLDATLRITRADFEDLIRDRVEETLDELARTIRDAGVDVDDLAGIYLAGGSSRIPLVQRMVTERFGPKVQMLDEPKTVVARGAALASDEEMGEFATHDATSAGVAAAHGAAHRDRGGGPGGPESRTAPGPSSAEGPGAGPAPPSARRRRRRAALVGAAVVVVLTLTAVLGIVLTGNHGHHPAGADTSGTTRPTKASSKPPVRRTTTTATPTSRRLCNDAFCVTAAPGWTENTAYSSSAGIALNHTGHPDELLTLGNVALSQPSLSAAQIIQQVFIPQQLAIAGATTSQCAASVQATTDGVSASGFVCYPRVKAPHILMMSYLETSHQADGPAAFIVNLTDDAQLTQADTDDPAINQMAKSVTPANTSTSTT